ncbi:hypothetical protein FACS1894122_15090 [Alphaproteobacteria bacterium]|nr:hypothetical protein FACS1894122_15090 [Alphaproteobacteria bacterium]
MIDKSEENISIRRQCELLSVCRSKLFYVPLESAIDKEILSKINEIWIESPFYGYRKVTHELHRRGYDVNHKKIQRLMSENGIFALTPKRRMNMSKASNEQKYPFLLKDVVIQRVNQVWSTDISYIKMPCGFLYLAAIVDVYGDSVCIS